MKWSKTGIYYYGCRYGLACHPDQLGESYFSSSQYVKRYIKEHGFPDIYKVTKTFNTIESCREWEDKVLVRINAKYNPKFLNKSQGAYGNSICKFITTPINSSAKRILREMEKDMLDIPFLNLSSVVESFGIGGRCWVNYKHIIILWFDDNDCRNDFLENNPEWTHGRNTEKANIRLSIAGKGKKKPSRSREHADKISKVQLGRNKPGSGPRKPLDYYIKIEDRKQGRILKALLRHRIFLYFLDMKFLISSHDFLFESFLSQGWCTVKTQDDLEYKKERKSELLSSIHKNRVRAPIEYTETNRSNMSNGSRIGHVTRKANKLKQLNQAVL